MSSISDTNDKHCCYSHNLIQSVSKWHNQSRSGCISAVLHKVITQIALTALIPLTALELLVRIVIYCPLWSGSIQKDGKLYIKNNFYSLLWVLINAIRNLLCSKLPTSYKKAFDELEKGHRKCFSMQHKKPPNRGKYTPDQWETLNVKYTLNDTGDQPDIMDN